MGRRGRGRQWDRRGRRAASGVADGRRCALKAVVRCLARLRELGASGRRAHKPGLRVTFSWMMAAGGGGSGLPLVSRAVRRRPRREPCLRAGAEASAIGPDAQGRRRGACAGLSAGGLLTAALRTGLASPLLLHNTPAGSGGERACPKSGLIHAGRQRAVENDTTGGSREPPDIHPRPIRRPKLVPKFTAEPLAFIGRPRQASCERASHASFPRKPGPSGSSSGCRLARESRCLSAAPRGGRASYKRICEAGLPRLATIEL